ncbi:hypothetical protein P171DRAFT_449469 [Karstenula rhodostoma CBS 690.94]|uniref:Uncharacterized protein n=1 Tax=Karstenula rhodostoma CBS 690.94 TaxID=1392251 RepID=A0A9P4U5P7_9PLEO|nr:hypothetical protein P171DRAFT_449469 [Karstenula rhodostoma CBS 690.94]
MSQDQVHYVPVSLPVGSPSDYPPPLEWVPIDDGIENMWFHRGPTTCRQLNPTISTAITVPLESGQLGPLMTDSGYWQILQCSGCKLLVDPKTCKTYDTATKTWNHNIGIFLVPPGFKQFRTWICADDWKESARTHRIDEFGQLRLSRSKDAAANPTCMCQELWRYVKHTHSAQVKSSEASYQTVIIYIGVHLFWAFIFLLFTLVVGSRFPS